MSAPKKTSSDDLRVAISELLKALKETSDSSESFSLTRAKPYWTVCSDKFSSVWVSINKPDTEITKFEDVFYDFYEKNRDSLLMPIVEDGRVMDDWLKVDDVIPTPWMKGKTKSRKVKWDDDLSWSIETNLKGLVVYFNEDDASMRRVAVPLSEGYRAAVTIYKEGASKKEASYSPLPAKILYNLYCICYHLAKKSDRHALKANMDIMKETVDSLSVETEEGSTLDPMRSMIKSLSKGLGGAAGLDDSKITSMMGSLFAPGVAEKMQNMVSEVSKKVGSITDASGRADAGKLMDQIGAVLQETGTKALIQETLEAATSIHSSIPTAATVPLAATSAAATAAPTSGSVVALGGAGTGTVDPSCLE